MISLIALAVSVGSVLFSIHIAGLNRRMQFEQVRGNLTTRLTIRGLEIITLVHKLRSQEPRQIKIMEILGKVADGIIIVREKLQTLSAPPFFTGTITLGLINIKSDIDDSEHIFDTLKKAFENSDYQMMETIATGLLERFWNKKSS